MADHKSWQLGGNLELNLHKTIPRSEYRKVPSGQLISEVCYPGPHHCNQCIPAVFYCHLYTHVLIVHLQSWKYRIGGRGYHCFNGDARNEQKRLNPSISLNHRHSISPGVVYDRLE